MKEVTAQLVRNHNNTAPTVSKIEFVFEDVDILRGGERHDMSRASVRKHYLNSIKDGEWDLLLCSPPCETWSREYYSPTKWAQGPAAIDSTHGVGQSIRLYQ